MLFNSFLFVFGFLPVVLGGYFVLSRLGRTAGAGWLIAASFVFYGWGNPRFAILLAISIGLNYAVSIGITRLSDHPIAQGWVTGGGIAFNLGALAYYKYLGSLAGFVHVLTDRMPLLDPIALPLGISFFSFTQIGYLIDCKTGLAKERGPLNYLLFVTFFPHLIAGPILHNRDIMPQFACASTWRFSTDNFAAGTTMFVIGLLKKVVFADPLSHWVTKGYADPATLTLAQSWNLVLCYSLQLYFDFSGYSDMAIGLARMVNVRFPMNFNSPYKAQSVIEYWQRWHITLTTFLTAYLYTPLALRLMRGRRARKRPLDRAAQCTVSGFTAMIAMPLFATMGLAGIWHGSGLNFVIFGLLHASYLTVNHAWRLWRPGLGSRSAGSMIGRIVLTYLAVLIASVFFRAPSLQQAVQVLAGMVGRHGTGAPSMALQLQSVGGASHLVWLGWLAVVVWALPNSQQIMHRCDPVLGPVDPPRWRGLVWRRGLSSSLALGAGLAVAIVAFGGTGEFLYFQF